MEAAGTEMLFHEAANRLPLRRTDPALKAAIGDDFDVAIRQLNVDQDAVVAFGIPNAQSRKDFQRMSARGDIVQDVIRRQRRFDREANLTGMRRFGSGNGLLDGIESRGGK